jgi:hypothetical protein
MKGYNGFTADMRNAAQAWLNREWKAGRVSRPTKCCACGQTHGIIDAHAEEYSMPFRAGVTDQFPLCYRCHMIVHCRFGRGAASWETYRQNIRAGTMFAAMKDRNFGRFSAETLRGERGCSAAFVVNEPPALRPLDAIATGRWLKCGEGS